MRERRVRRAAAKGVVEEGWGWGEGGRGGWWGGGGLAAVGGREGWRGVGGEGEEGGGGETHQSHRST